MHYTAKSVKILTQSGYFNYISFCCTAQDKHNTNKTGHVCVNVSLRHIPATTGAAEKQ